MLLRLHYKLLVGSCTILASKLVDLLRSRDNYEGVHMSTILER